MLSTIKNSFNLPVSFAFLNRLLGMKQDGMKESNIQRLIRRYFDHVFSSGLQAYFMAWLLDPSHQAEKERAMRDLWSQISSEEDASTQEELTLLQIRIRQYALRRRRWVQVLTASFLLLPLLGGLATYHFMNRSVPYTTPVAELVEYFAPQGERRLIVLSDSTEVWLDAGSVLICSKYFDNHSRTLFLIGQANFKVTRDVQRPFTVKTTYIDVQALGTTFNVEAYSDMESTTTSLQEGSVLVKTKDGAQSMVIAPNEQIVYYHQSQKIVKNNIDAERKARWKDGDMVFQSSSFAYMMKSMERKFNVNIYYEARKYDNRYYTVRFAPDENLLHVLDILKEMIPGFRYKVKSKVVYIN